ncbi:hypothetical protein PGT21_022459 [Puccinia graminis f. sp. tritici]|uniref:Uncharacterized protein n=1 Tax=Puccinia graminis f. sp. tritici TaxID=56615 RepID=A0A5B0NNR4_PUCGR|nr:hypothetical protein PGT21_022459 [Puccinia graminis f. sp. tritici]
MIRRSSSQYTSPTKIIPKKDPSALPHWVCDYRTLNSLTVRNWSPLPNVDELVRTVATGKVFSTHSGSRIAWLVEALPPHGLDGCLSDSMVIFEIYQQITKCVSNLSHSCSTASPALTLCIASAGTLDSTLLKKYVAAANLKASLPVLSKNLPPYYVTCAPLESLVPQCLMIPKPLRSHGQRKTLSSSVKKQFCGS